MLGHLGLVEEVPFLIDMNRMKRVKFQDPGTDKLPNCRPDASSIQNDAPKTSEYAFFKKLKKNACGHSYPVEKGNNQLKDVELSECTEGEFAVVS